MSEKPCLKLIGCQTTSPLLKRIKKYDSYEYLTEVVRRWTKRLEEYKLTLEIEMGHLMACLGAFLGTAILIPFNDFLIILK